jgi:asparaginyl-tRNA synthetase
MNSIQITPLVSVDNTLINQSVIQITPLVSVDNTLINQSVTVHGWVNSIRKGKQATFIDIMDNPDKNNSLLQCVASGSHKDAFDLVYHKSFICVTGTIVATPPKAKTIKGIEMQITNLVHNSMSKSDYDSIAPRGSYNHANHCLYLRHTERCNFILLTDLVLNALSDTARSMNMIKITPPLYGSVKCEGGSELYETDHFGTKAYLTQSSQMYLEATLPAVLTGTYCDVPSFRREKSRTKRHLTQFTHWECEVFGMYTLDMFLNFLRNFINTFFTKLFELDKFNVLNELGRVEFIKSIISKEITVLEHSSAINLLNETGVTKADGSKFEPYDDIPEAQERKLIDSIGTIVFLTKFPTMTKAFYTATDPQDKTRALAVDVEFPLVGEILGCSLRESSSSTLRQKLNLFTLRDVSDNIFTVMTELGLNNKEIETKIALLIHEQDDVKLKEYLLELIDLIKTQPATESTITSLLEQINNIPYDDYKWYFDLRDYGMAKTGGFGLGVERLVTWLSGGEIIDGTHNYSIHSVTTFPRTVDRLTP